MLATFRIKSLTNENEADILTSTAGHTFDYQQRKCSSNRLAQITDPIGIVSQFQYDSGDFINRLITP